MKVVFLDFDGPIIPILSHHKRKAAYEAGDKTPLAAWPACIAALNRITDTTGAVIVVSSTWRADGLMRTRERLCSWGVKADCIALTPYLDRKMENGLWEPVPRGLEIQKWLDDYERETVESFVIIDDDQDMEHLLPRLIHTPFEDGLTEADADRAIEMLQPPQSPGSGNGESLS